MRIHCFQHVSFESPGTIEEWAGLQRYTVTYTHFFDPQHSFPLLKDLDALIIMGGYMNVNEEDLYPWLIEEKLFIKQAIQQGKKVLGICLGAQLIAAALGSKVYKGKEKEIGFFPIQFTDAAIANPLFSHFPNPYMVFHWHGDTFDLPENAQLIASTPVCKHQAFLMHSHVLGLQFHMEMNTETIGLMIANDENELLEEGNYIQDINTIRNEKNILLNNRKDIFELLNKFINL